MTTTCNDIRLSYRLPKPDPPPPINVDRLLALLCDPMLTIQECVNEAEMEAARDKTERILRN